jgi:hypothetical protein
LYAIGWSGGVLQPHSLAQHSANIEQRQIYFIQSGILKKHIILRKKIMSRLFLLTLFILGISCNNEYKQDSKTVSAKDSVAKQSQPVGVSLTRDVVNPKPVATFVKKVPDKLNDWKFAVSIYETKETFHYLMKMQYMELRADDTLKIPNFGTAPKVEIKQGSEPFSCIVGFLDKNNQFKEYKLVSIKDKNLSVHILRRYAVTTYESK